MILYIPAGNAEGNAATLAVRCTAVVALAQRTGGLDKIHMKYIFYDMNGITPDTLGGPGSGAGLPGGAEIFAGLDEAALDEVRAAARRRRLGPDQALFRQGDPATAFCVLLTGELKMVQTSPEGAQVIVRYIAPGEMFGAVALFCRIPYPATALAVVASEVAIWDAASADRLMRTHAEIAANALRIVGRRLQDLQNRYRELATERVEQRVAHTLLRLAARDEGKAVAEEGDARGPGAKGQIEFPLSRQDVAEMTGTTLHSASRILSRWESLGLIGGGRRRITLHRPEALARIAGGVWAGGS